MEHIAITAQTRGSAVSKGERNRLRRAGHIPAAVFGKGIPPTLVTVEAKDIAQVLASAAGVNTLVDLTLDGKRHLVKMTEVEIDPLTRVFQHIGLHKIQASEPQKASVPVELVGEPEAVRLGEGLLEQAALTVDIRALPERLVASLPLDISGMTIGDVLRASDLEMPKGMELLTAPDAALVSLHVARAVVTETEVEHEEEEIGPTGDSSSPEESLENV